MFQGGGDRWRFTVSTGSDKAVMMRCCIGKYFFLKSVVIANFNNKHHNGLGKANNLHVEHNMTHSKQAIVIFEDNDAIGLDNQAIDQSG